MAKQKIPIQRPPNEQLDADVAALRKKYTMEEIILSLFIQATELADSNLLLPSFTAILQTTELPLDFSDITE